ncbi:hypothetical protein ACN47E_004703 [Coniothyrium glycines]
MDNKFEDIDAIRDFVEERTETMHFRGEEQNFLPKVDFETITTLAVIRLAVFDDSKLAMVKNEESREKFAKVVHEKARVLFTMCVVGLQSSFPMLVLNGLMNEGLTDASLPLNRNSLASCTNKELTKEFKQIYDKQKLFRTAYFALNSYQNLDGVTKPVKLEEGLSNILGKGAFGEVFRIEIHPQHRQFASGANQKGEFALKVTHQEGRELDFHRQMSDLQHTNLLKCLASFTFSSRYHMIYEKADSDVEDFMDKHKFAHECPDLSAEDLASQFYGLAAALQVIHDQDNGSPADPEPNLLGVPGSKPARSGYIHDIKPDNILLFIYEVDGKKRYWFRLSDFSCAKVVSFVQSVSGGKRHSHLSDNKAGNPTYRAPEMLMGRGTSRPYDLWSLGCVYLELLVWYLDGFDALLRFRSERFRMVRPGTIEDEGFCFTDEAGDNAKVLLRETVQRKMVELSERCTGGLRDIAEVIPQLLKINPKQRPTAAQLKDMLKHLDTGERPPSIDDQSDVNNTFGASNAVMPSYDSDSDGSSFGGFITVTHPSK